jgi:hypothetical protein
MWQEPQGFCERCNKTFPQSEFSLATPRGYKRSFILCRSCIEFTEAVEVGHLPPKKMAKSKLQKGLVKVRFEIDYLPTMLDPSEYRPFKFNCNLHLDSSKKFPGSVPHERKAKKKEGKKRQVVDSKAVISSWLKRK